MKCVFLVVLLAAAATAAVSNDVPDVVELFDVADGDEADLNEMPEVVVTDVHEFADEADETAVDSRLNLIQGTVGPSDVRVHNSEQRENAIPGQIVQRDIPIRTNRWISAIRVIRIGASQNATPSIVSGGINHSFVTIRIRSAVGRGYNYIIEVFGR